MTAQDKIKKLANGEFKRHIYYCCNRKVDPNCNEKYINEENLCVLLQKYIEKNYDRIPITDKLLARIEKHYAITQSLLKHYNIVRKLDSPFIEYSRYVLSNGTESEKTNLSNGLITQINIRDGVLNKLS